MPIERGSEARLMTLNAADYYWAAEDGGIGMTKVLITPLLKKGAMPAGSKFAKWVEGMKWMDVIKRVNSVYG